MNEDYVDRVRERLAGGSLLDVAFDDLFPPSIRSKSTLHWTPVGVARLAAKRLQEHGARYVLDAGSGPGKFCVVGAGVYPELTFLGIERRGDLVAAATELASRLGVMNAYFEIGDATARSWAPFDGFYSFNPFTRSGGSDRRPSEARGNRAEHGFDSEGRRLLSRLREARQGSVLVTYHGLGGPIPSSYELVSDESTGTGRLRTWLKAREDEENWVYLDEAAVSRCRLPPSLSPFA